MLENINTGQDFNSSNFISFLYKWRKHLLWVTLISVVLSLFFSSSLFITPKYKSTVIMFPASSNAISRAILMDNPSAKTDILEFGEEEQAEQLLQILYSTEIRAKIIKKYSLMYHYRIDSTSKFKMTRLFEEYKNNINFKRNEFMAVEINVLDKDPQIAADIANDVAALVDSVKNKIQKQRVVYGVKIVEKEYLAQKKELAKLEDSINSLRKLGINNYESESQMMYRQLAMEIAKNNRPGMKALDDELDIIANYGGQYISLRDEIGYARGRLNFLKNKYEEAKTDAEKVIPQKFVVDYAFKAEKKAYPIRWLIVLISALSSLLITMLIIIILENFKKVINN